MNTEPTQLPDPDKEARRAKIDALIKESGRDSRSEVEHRRAFLAGDKTARPISMDKIMTPESHPNTFGMASRNVKRTKD
jgi:hypothetical protein